MTKYLVLWKANAAAWPTEPKAALKVIQGVITGGDMLLGMGPVQELGWFTPQQGYAIFEAEDKAVVMGMVQPFFPYYEQEIHEIVPWDHGKESILSGARQAAEGMTTFEDFNTNA